MPEVEIEDANQEGEQVGMWDRLGPVTVVMGAVIGLLISVATWVWYTSELFYRVEQTERKIIQVDTRISEDQKIISATLVAEAKISDQIDNLNELINRLIAQEDNREKNNNVRRQ